MPSGTQRLSEIVTCTVAWPCPSIQYFYCRFSETMVFAEASTLDRLGITRLRALVHNMHVRRQSGPIFLQIHLTNRRQMSSKCPFTSPISVRIL